MECISQEIKIIIGKVCGIEKISILGEEDDLKSEWGVDSLQMVKILVDIEKKYQCDLSEIFICENNITIKLLVDYILRKRDV